MDDDWGKRWTRIVGLKSQLYDLPGGAVGREFVSLLTGEVTILSRGEAKSECLIVCMNVMLQRDAMVRRGADIRRLLKRRMEMWRESRFDELTHEAERCAKQRPIPRKHRQYHH